MASARATRIGDLAYAREHVRADAEVREVAALFEQTFDLEAVAVVAEDVFLPAPAARIAI